MCGAALALFELLFDCQHAKVMLLYNCGGGLYLALLFVLAAVDGNPACFAWLMSAVSCVATYLAHNFEVLRL